MTTTARVQADTLHDDVKRLVVADQFASDWLLVAMNDFPQYSLLVEEAKSAQGSVSRLSDSLRNDWEALAAQVVELVENQISPTASLFIAQILQGQGSLPFDLIAREVLKTEEASA